MKYIKSVGFVKKYGNLIWLLPLFAFAKTSINREKLSIAAMAEIEMLSGMVKQLKALKDRPHLQTVALY